MDKEVMDISAEMPEEHQDKPFPAPTIVRVPVKHANLGIRSHAMDMSTMVELTSFSTLGKIQPFLVTISATAALLVDLHCHLTDKEVCGYLGGHWDINAHNLSILGAYPCRYAGKDKSAAAAVEAEIAKAMEWKRMTLVGWYHSHPRSHASPSLRDVDAQLDYQIKMKGPSDNGYTPCIGLICSPYNTEANCYESNFNVFWSMPPPENRPHEYPRPMLLSYTLSQEQFISQDALEEIKKCIEYYKLEGGIDFTTKFNGGVTYLERLRSSLASKLPGRNNRSNGSYWDLIREMICPGYDDGSDSSFIMKFPIVPEPLLQSASVNTGNVFLAPVNFKSENSVPLSKSFIATQLESSYDGNHHKESSSAMKHAMAVPEAIPTFRSGELTVSLKSSKCDYDYSPTDFSKASATIEPSKRSEYPLTDCLTQQMAKFPDFSKLANFSPADIAKLSGFSLNDFTKVASQSAYVRNIASLFGPLSKGVVETNEINDRMSADYAEQIHNQFKASSSSSSSPSQETNRTVNTSVEDYSSERKKAESMDMSNYPVTEDLSMHNTNPDFSGMLDMTTKKHHHTVDSGDTLNLSKDR